MLFDSHAHLNHTEFTDKERRDFIENISRAVEEGKMSLCMDIGFDLPSSKMAREHAERYPWCYAAVGCHPHDTKTMDQEKLEEIKKLAADPKVVAIGEIGLDFHYDHSERDIQREWFREQIKLANQLKMPICIHAREADQEVMNTLIEEGAFSKERKAWFPERPDENGDLVPDARVLLHCYSGSAELAKEYIKLGATLSIAGPVTYKNNKKTVSVVETVPIEYLLVETDSPFLTPVPFRGKRNMPPYVEYTAKKVAEIKGFDFNFVAMKTAENARRFYGISVDCSE